MADSTHRLVVRGWRLCPLGTQNDGLSLSDLASTACSREEALLVQGVQVASSRGISAATRLLVELFRFAAIAFLRVQDAEFAGSSNISTTSLLLKEIIGSGQLQLQHFRHVGPPQKLIGSGQ